MITWSTIENLGTVSEGSTISLSLVAVDSTGTAVVYSLIAGILPSGVTLSPSGQLSGVALGNIIYKFVVRASGNSAVSDRTFRITIQGNNPIIAGTLTEQFDITDYSYQLTVTDLDVQDTVNCQISAGSLPQALSLSSTGRISGIIVKQPSKKFNFTVVANDGTYKTYKDFELTVINRPDGTAVKPVILNRISNIGTFRTEDQFSYKISGSVDGIKEPLAGMTYTIGSGVLPPGLVLEIDTGWINGFLSTASFPVNNQITYTFTVIPSYNSVSGDPKTFRIAINTIPITVESSNWINSPDLGSIRLGDISNFTVSPFPVGSTMTFRIRVGTTGILPPNLYLLPDGSITGRVSFLGSRSTPANPVGVYTFTVEMVNYSGVVAAVKNFTIRTLYQAPYERVYLQAFPRPKQRERILNLLTNPQIIPQDAVYRPQDPNYGIVPNFRMLLLLGLLPNTAEHFVAAMVKSHQRKVAYIREFKYAVAVNIVTNVPVYEVVYAILKDRQYPSPASITLQKFSNPQLKVNNTQVNASYGGIISADQNKILEVYPNSFDNMRTVISSSIGFAVTDILSKWRSTIQDDGGMVGIANVLPLAFLNPGRGEEVLSNIITSGERFNLVPFDVDGLVWDDYVQPTTVGPFEISTSGITTKYLAFPRTGITKYSGQQL